MISKPKHDIPNSAVEDNELDFKKFNLGLGSTRDKQKVLNSVVSSMISDPG